jgi:DNA processing protein
MSYAYPSKELSPEEFPPLLREINDPPRTLRVRGTLPDFSNKFLTVVGSRAYTPYGKETCEKLIEGLRGYPIVIVSGLALGTDAIAHKAALSTGLTTVAVPGSGLDDRVLYPSSNRSLAREILSSNGALLSEFENDFRATPYSFPQRNRIMAGMSHAVLIIEATQKSGTLITSRLATEYNRDVLTVPGSIFRASSYGPHMLIKRGAIPITESADILEVFNLRTAETLPLDLNSLSTQERKVIEILANPLPRDELIRALNISVTEANILLSAMELKGLITEAMGEVMRG